MENIILTRINAYKDKIDTLVEKINEYDRIAVFRHDHPDYDAIGTQLGLVELIKTNFPNKEIIYVGDDHITLTGHCFPKMMEVNDEWFEKPFLSIVVDLSNFERIADERANKGDYIVKIDHHPAVDPYADLEIVDESMAAAGELLATIAIYKNLTISQESAGYMWKAIVGDSGRFLYHETSTLTFYVAQVLMSTGINIRKLYSDMYQESINDLEVRKFILSTYKVSKNGVAYYILSDEDLKRFNLTPIQGKENVNIFAHFKEINAWLSCTQDIEKGHWRVSIRSSKTPINGIAGKYNGGGHSNAAGVKVPNLEVFQELVNDLDKLFE